MHRSRKLRLEDEEQGPPGLYDGALTEAEEPWFSPSDPPEAPRPATGLGLDAWREAQRALSAELAEAVAAVAGLDMRLRHGRAGWHEWLVSRAAAGLGWQMSARISADRLALYRQGVISSAGDAELAQSLRALSWAARRWGSGLAPLPVLAFLGEPEEAVSLDGRFAERPRRGALALQAVQGDTADFGGFEQAVEAADLHPFLRAAYAQAAWERLGLDYDRAALQGLVLAASVGAQGLRGGLRFLPVSLAGTLPGGGAPEARCRRWLAAAGQGALRGLLEIDRLEAWRARAMGQGRGGRGRPLVIEALERAPVVSVRGIAEAAGLSRASVQNILGEMLGQGLVREVTGNARYRVFTVAMG